METQRYAYICLHENDVIDDERHYIPCLVKENIGGYFPMRGRDELSLPWYWGKSHAECQKHCDDENKLMGLSEEDVRDIISSSIRAQNMKN